MFRRLFTTQWETSFSHKTKLAPKSNFSRSHIAKVTGAGLTTAAIAMELANSNEPLKDNIEKNQNPDTSDLIPKTANEPQRIENRKDKLIQKLILLDRAEKTLEQTEKDRLYKEIISLRPSCAKDFDAIGYNQLHWAVFCNQPVNEIIRLLKEDIDINCGTEFVKPIMMSNITPLHIAIKIGSKALAECLLNNGATSEYQLNQLRPLTGPLSANDYSTQRGQELSAAKFALQQKNATFTLFEKTLLEEHRNKLSKDQNEYNSILPSSIAACFYYSNKQELKAANKLTKLLNNEPDNVTALKTLKDKYPAVEQNELGEIYSSSIRARS